MANASHTQLPQVPPAGTTDIPSQPNVSRTDFVMDCMTKLGQAVVVLYPPNTLMAHVLSLLPHAMEPYTTQPVSLLPMPRQLKKWPSPCPLWIPPVTPVVCDSRSAIANFSKGRISPQAASHPPPGTTL
ncbi:hypothetical protein HPB50_000240 [Hyalomma asiaticum]|uniref:Uncharacterized protein n=1 Tax=Hyalomma asiaticum TaxID=266040 RepID=A0ACB7SA56_HYAAI|nr:hypothetical protein HPB50_000240 [Hyalomma asiaticum]